MLEMGGGRDCMVSEIPSNSGGLPISNWNPAVRRQQLVNFSSHLKRSQKIFGSSSLAWEVVAHRHHSQDINRLFQMLYFHRCTTYYADCQLWTICSFFQGRSCLFANCTRVTLGSIEIRTPPRRSLHGACEITCTLIPGEGHQWVLGSKVMETRDRILRRTEMKSSDYSGKMSNMKEKSFCSELGTTPNGISPFELLHFWLSHAMISFLPCN